MFWQVFIDEQLKQFASQVEMFQHHGQWQLMDSDGAEQAKWAQSVPHYIIDIGTVI